MTADILQPTVSQDTLTGQIEKVWTVSQTVSCYAESILTDAVSDASSGKKFNREYNEFEYINLHLAFPVSKRTRIQNIRGANGVVLWPQLERPNNSMIFEVQGCIPLINPFGQVTQYKVLARKVEVQNDQA